MAPTSPTTNAVKVDPVQTNFFLDKKPFIRNAVKIGRNDPCYCGSGMKYKKCHLEKQVLRKV